METKYNYNIYTLKQTLKIITKEVLQKYFRKL